MRTVHTLFLAGVAAAVVAGSALAAGNRPPVHQMTVPLPWGGVAHIEYAGDIPPKVTLDGDPFPVNVFSSGVFADLDRQMTMFERETQALMARTGLSKPNGLYSVSAGALPAGTESYSAVSTFTSNGACTKSVAITTPANGGKPKIVRRSSGNCGADHEGAHSGKPIPPAAPPRSI